ncbi:MAG: exodeoxyribonuclease III, partial [Gammaproteobacteria bacterium]|nr:exodeoxyribonuclease III [Gammaproteobacteria bacterium]
MRVVSANLNGIRAAAKKGFFDWMKQHKPDVVCIQETKAQEHQLDDEVFSPKGYFRYFFDAEKKGYSGTAIYTRHEPDQVSTGLGWTHADSEGRWIEAQFGKLTVASLYLPSGSSSDERQQNKLIFMDQLREDMQAMRRKRREFIICGDWNIVHKEIDIKNFKSNQKNSGCTPVER